MRKHKELSNPKSCLNKANTAEPLFVLLGRDAAAPAAIRAWIAARLELGLNKEGDPQLEGAVRAIELFNEEQKQWRELADLRTEAHETLDKISRLRDRSMVSEETFRRIKSELAKREAVLLSDLNALPGAKDDGVFDDDEEEPLVRKMGGLSAAHLGIPDYAVAVDTKPYGSRSKGKRQRLYYVRTEVEDGVDAEEDWLPDIRKAFKVRGSVAAQKLAKKLTACRPRDTSEPYHVEVIP